MYEVIIDGFRKDITDHPVYVRMSGSGAWIETDRDMAEMVSVRGMLCNIAGKKPFIDTAPTAIINDLTECDRVIEQNTAFENLESKQNTTNDNVTAVMLGQADQVSQAQTVNDSVNAIMLGQTDQVTQAKTTDDSVNAIMLALTDLAASVADIQSKLTK